MVRKFACNPAPRVFLAHDVGYVLLTKAQRIEERLRVLGRQFGTRRPHCEHHGQTGERGPLRSQIEHVKRQPEFAINVVQYPFGNGIARSFSKWAACMWVGSVIFPLSGWMSVRHEGLS